MILRVYGIAEGKSDPILEAIDALWEWDVPYTEDGALHAEGVDYLCGSVSEEEFARHLARAIWEANEGFCDVSVLPVYLDEPKYTFNETDWSNATKLKDDHDQFLEESEV
jgi:hypothetical protein